MPRGGAPNVLVTGTPGTGKTSLCAELLRAVRFAQHINVGEWVKTNELHEGWDDALQCYVLDEDALLDAMEPVLGAPTGGCLVDHHACELFPERWFDLVVVLRADNAVLHERLTARGYAGRKLEENMEAEIMQIILEEARESYKADVLMVLESNTVGQQEANVQAIIDALRAKGFALASTQ